MEGKIVHKTAVAKNQGFRKGLNKKNVAQIAAIIQPSPMLLAQTISLSPRGLLLLLMKTNKVVLSYCNKK